MQRLSNFIGFAQVASLMPHLTPPPLSLHGKHEGDTFWLKLQALIKHPHQNNRPPFITHLSTSNQNNQKVPSRFLRIVYLSKYVTSELNLITKRAQIIAARSGIFEFYMKFWYNWTKNMSSTMPYFLKLTIR